MTKDTSYQTHQNQVLWHVVMSLAVEVQCRSVVFQLVIVPKSEKLFIIMFIFPIYIYVHVT